MQNGYKYRDKTLTPKRAEQLILTLFGGTPRIKKEYITAGIFQFHKS